MVKKITMDITFKKCKMIKNKKFIQYIIDEAVKRKLSKPIMGEEQQEENEATGAASAGGYSAPAFSMWSEDDVARSEYKKSEEYCDSCDRVKSKCVCKTGKKIEATEATTAGAGVGAYDAPGFQDVNMKGNTTKGKGTSWTKSQIPGGSFVEIDSKCKTFPYCNQGNTGAVKYRKPSGKRKNKKLTPMNEAILNVSLKTGLSVDEIKNIILTKINNNL
jgi:hypothetical protein